MRSVIVAGVVEAGYAAIILSRRSGSAELQALGGVRLVPARQALHHVVTGGENVAHIVKESETEAFTKPGQADGRKAEFLTVDEQRRATNGKTGIGIAGSSLI